MFAVQHEDISIKIISKNVMKLMVGLHHIFIIALNPVIIQLIPEHWNIKLFVEEAIVKLMQ